MDEDGADVVQGEVGEIVARGERLMSGYWGRGEATAETIRGGWLHTGDLAYSDEDGYIFLAGRARDFIKRGGEMISPEEVEGVLHSHPAIDEAAIIGVPDVQWGEHVRAVVVLRDGSDASEAEIIDYCRERLASFKKPESVLFAPALPRNTLGKDPQAPAAGRVLPPHRRMTARWVAVDHHCDVQFPVPSERHDPGGHSRPSASVGSLISVPSTSAPSTMTRNAWLGSVVMLPLPSYHPTN